jgi:hypothetical protein
MRGVRRLVPRGSEPEDPKARVKPRAKGEEASHELPGVLNGDSGARANRERKGGLQNTGNFNHREGKKKMKEFFPLIIFSINKTLWLPLFWLLSPVRSGGEKEQKNFFFFCFSSLAFPCSVFSGAPTIKRIHPLSS